MRAAVRAWTLVEEQKTKIKRLLTLVLCKVQFVHARAKYSTQKDIQSRTIQMSPVRRTCLDSLLETTDNTILNFDKVVLLKETAHSARLHIIFYS